jgi:metal-sulfur cluster biosynthetic enzyme
MTLTTPNCPSAEEMPQQVENAVAGVPGVREAKVNIAVKNRNQRQRKA